MAKPVCFPSTMSNTGDDLRREGADGEGAVDTQRILKALDWALNEAQIDYGRWRSYYGVASGDGPLITASINRVADLRTARAIIAAVAPAICQACGAVNPGWLVDGGGNPVRFACAGCGHNPIAVAGNPASPHGDGEAGAFCPPGAPAARSAAGVAVDRDRAGGEGGGVAGAPGPAARDRGA